MCYAIMSTPHVMCSVIVVLPSLAKVHECNLMVFTCLLSFFSAFSSAECNTILTAGYAPAIPKHCCIGHVSVNMYNACSGQLVVIIMCKVFLHRLDHTQPCMQK